jgi:hypothetical protein
MVFSQNNTPTHNSGDNISELDNLVSIHCLLEIQSTETRNEISNMEDAGIIFAFA